MSANTTPVKVKKTDLSGTSTAYKVFAVVILIMLAIFFQIGRASCRERVLRLV